MTTEQEVLRTRTHGKALVLPGCALVLLGAGVGAGTALVPDGGRPYGQLAVAAAGLVLALWWCLLPFLRWLTTTYVVTDRRLVSQSGVLHRRSHELALSRVLDVRCERSLLDRLLGCGTLVVQTAAEGGAVVLVDVPEVGHVQQTMAALLFGPVERSWPESRRG